MSTIFIYLHCLQVGFAVLYNLSPSPFPHTLLLYLLTTSPPNPNQNFSYPPSYISQSDILAVNSITSLYYFENNDSIKKLKATLVSSSTMRLYYMLFPAFVISSLAQPTSSASTISANTILVPYASTASTSGYTSKCSDVATNPRYCDLNDKNIILDSERNDQRLRLTFPNAGWKNIRVGPFVGTTGLALAIFPEHPYLSITLSMFSLFNHVSADWIWVEERTNAQWTSKQNGQQTHPGQHDSKAQLPNDIRTTKPMAKRQDGCDATASDSENEGERDQEDDFCGETCGNKNRRRALDDSTSESDDKSQGITTDSQYMSSTTSTTATAIPASPLDISATINIQTGSLSPHSTSSTEISASFLSNRYTIETILVTSTIAIPDPSASPSSLPYSYTGTPNFPAIPPVQSAPSIIPNLPTGHSAAFYTSSLGTAAFITGGTNTAAEVTPAQTTTHVPYPTSSATGHPSRTMSNQDSSSTATAPLRQFSALPTFLHDLIEARDPDSITKEGGDEGFGKRTSTNWCNHHIGHRHCQTTRSTHRTQTTRSIHGTQSSRSSQRTQSSKGSKNSKSTWVYVLASFLVLGI